MIWWLNSLSYQLLKMRSWSPFHITHYHMNQIEMDSLRLVVLALDAM